MRVVVCITLRFENIVMWSVFVSPTAVLFRGPGEFLWQSQAKTLGIHLLVGEGQKLHFDKREVLSFPGFVSKVFLLSERWLAVVLAALSDGVGQFAYVNPARSNQNVANLCPINCVLNIICSLVLSNCVLDIICALILSEVVFWDIMLWHSICQTN